jgi:8-amino-7-oxononanoate synthase
VFTPYAGGLADYLLQRGYPVVPMTYPVVEKERPRIRVIIHASNTEEEIDSFLNEILTWAERQVRASPPTRSASGSVAAGKLAEARAKL